MNYISISTAESRSDRFDRLCSRLKASEQSDRLRVLGHLALWRETWGGRPETDHGYFWRRTLSDMGRWAAWDDPRQFGAALHDAGYLAAIEDRHPECLRRGLGGLVAMADREGLVALDCSWDSYHRRAPSASKLVWFLSSEPRRFAEAAAMLSAEEVARLAADGLIPAAWAGHVEALRQRERNTTTLLSVPPPTTCPPPTSAEEPIRRNPRPVTSTSDGTERNGTGQDGNGTESNDAPTGRRGSFGLLDDLRRTKNAGDAFRCLLLLDDSPRAVNVWRVVSAKHPRPVLELVSELTQDDVKWARLKNPAAVAMKRLLPYVTPTAGSNVKR